MGPNCRNIAAMNRHRTPARAHAGAILARAYHRATHILLQCHRKTQATPARRIPQISVITGLGRTFREKFFTHQISSRHEFSASVFLPHCDQHSLLAAPTCRDGNKDQYSSPKLIYFTREQRSPEPGAESRSQIQDPIVHSGRRCDAPVQLHSSADSQVHC